MRRRPTAKIEIADELAQHLDSKPWRGDFDLTGPTTNDTWGTSLNGEVALPWGMQFSNTSAYDTYDRLIDIDLDFSPQTLFHIKTEDDAWRENGEFSPDQRATWHPFFEMTLHRVAGSTGDDAGR